MKPTDFSRHLSNFLSKYLPGERGVSPNTISSYRYTFILFLAFMEKSKNISATKLNLGDVTREVVIDFLNWLQIERKCSPASQNVRLAALHSFFHFLQYNLPDHMAEWQRILSIQVKKSKKEPVSYLTLNGIKLLLEQPDTATRKGRRDLAMLALMYDSGARVQEIIDTEPSSIRMDKPYIIKIIGKGNKARVVPLVEQSLGQIKRYMEENNLLLSNMRSSPLFSNSRKEKLTRAGINGILKKYADMARNKNAEIIPEKISPHSLRHSKAMHLLQAGVNLVYIRDFLGHESVQTTEIYARADSKQKREAIEMAYVNVITKETPAWVENNNLLQWLKDFRQD